MLWLLQRQSFCISIEWWTKRYCTQMLRFVSQSIEIELNQQRLDRTFISNTRTNKCIHYNIGDNKLVVNWTNHTLINVSWDAMFLFDFLCWLLVRSFVRSFPRQSFNEFTSISSKLTEPKAHCKWSFRICSANKWQQQQKNTRGMWFCECELWLFVLLLLLFFFYVIGQLHCAAVSSPVHRSVLLKSVISFSLLVGVLYFVVECE